MPKNALHNPVAFAILGVLLERPMHPYELATVLTERGVPINRGSLYDTVDALARVSWITPLKTEQAGARPKRTLYQLTPDGQAELVRWLDEQIRTPHIEYPEFMGAVSHIGVLGKQRAVVALEERHRHLVVRIDRLTRQLDDARRIANAPRLFVIEAEYARAMACAEEQWIASTISDIHNDDLAWPSK